MDLDCVELIARSPAMREIVGLVPRVARADVSVLIEGEPGVEKTTLARQIHRQSPQSAGPFVQANCGAIRESELDGRLFDRSVDHQPENGHRPQALFEASKGGILFLEEIALLPFWAQVKLADVLQQPAGVRLIASTIGSLAAATEQNTFYSGLYYYLSAVHIRIPPLRLRQEDIAPLAECHLSAAVSRGDAPENAPRRFSPAAVQAMLHYDWPGNVLQLAGVVAQAAVLADGPEIGPDCMAESLARMRMQRVLPREMISVPLTGGLREMEQVIIREVIRRCRGNKAAAPRELGLHRRTLYRLLEQEDPAGEPDEMEPLVLAAAMG